jgi:hypothetical protein
MSGRARARRRTQIQPQADRPEPPVWIWQFRPADWPLKDGPVDTGIGGGTEVEIGRYCEARRLWRAACAKWLTTNEMVMLGRGLKLPYPEYKRLCKEEPHRILRGTDRPGHK